MGPLNGTITFTLDQGLLALVGLVLLGACGVVAIALGVAVNIWPNSRLSAKARQQFQRELPSWIGGVPANAAAEAQVDRLATQFAMLNGWSLIGLGVGVLVGVASVAGFAIGATGTLASLVASGGFLIYTILFQLVALGLTLGFAWGTWLTRRGQAARQRPSYGDLRRRRPADYRAAAFGWGPYLVAAFSCVFCLLLGLRLQRLVIAACGEQWSWSAPLALGVFAALAALIPLATTAFVRWAATSPRALVDDDAQVARGADDFRRALTIGVIQAYAWQSGGWTLLALANIAAENIRVDVGAPMNTPLEVASLAMWNVAFLLAGVSFVMGAIIMTLRGRLGGRVTGWRWPYSPAASNGLSSTAALQPSAPPLGAPHVDTPRP
ncbi:MAG TPA: hypothetical protein VMV29_06905 [Ktedonobacterales bacterium]|nr:hypothetical protein [Ktedonobacterales bacterium]